MKAILDTNILIDYLNGIKFASKEIAQYQEPMISVITWMEILVGAKDEKEERMIRHFLNCFLLAEINAEISELAILIRRKQRVRLPDAIIWATAQYHNALLVTRNTKDFPEQSPEIRVPYQLRP